MESTGPTTDDKQSSTQKMCLACNQTFGSQLSHCPKDGTQLVPFGHDDNLGKLINERFKIIEGVGKGGMGSVYLAEDYQQNKAYVAIKMLHAQLSEDKLSVKRFQQEASAASDLHHPNLIQQFDYGMIDGKQPFLVMEYLQGDSLSLILREEGPLSPPRALRIFSQVMDGLHYAHNKGVVHRDIKPSNILLLKKEDNEELVKVLDFGLAKLMPWSGKESQHLTKTGEVFGSPIYMSPEQCMGKQLEPSSDIYSLGITLYEALTGRPPFKGKNVVQTASLHLSEMPPPFETACPDLNLPLNLQAVVFKALEKDKINRYLNMQQFKDALSFAVTGQGKGGVHIQAAMTADATQQVRKVDLDNLRSSSHNFGSVKIPAAPEKKGMPPGVLVGSIVAALVVLVGGIFMLMPKSSSDGKTGIKGPSHHLPQTCSGVVAYLAVKPAKGPRARNRIREVHLLTEKGTVKLSADLAQRSVDDLQIGSIWKVSYKGDEKAGELSKYAKVGADDDLSGACNTVENFYRYLAEKSYMNVYDMLSENYLKTKYSGLSAEQVTKKLAEEYKPENLRISSGDERVSTDGSLQVSVLDSGEKLPLLQSIKIGGGKSGLIEVLVDSRFFLKKPDGIERFSFKKGDRFLKIESIETGLSEKDWEGD